MSGFGVGEVHRGSRPIQHGFFPSLLATKATSICYFLCIFSEQQVGVEASCKIIKATLRKKTELPLHSTRGNSFSLVSDF